MRKIAFKLTKKRFLAGFAAVVLVLAVVRWIWPSVAEPRVIIKEIAEAIEAIPLNHNGRPHKIRSVASYAVAFPDTNAVQLTAAQKWGVPPVRDREDAETRKRELVYVGANPYYHVDPLYSSIPYLVPRAAVLLQDIGQAFYDSLYVKGVPTC